MKRGLHASPVAYRREGMRPNVLPLRRVGTVRPADRERCPDCGSDKVERFNASTILCHNCGVEQLVAAPKLRESAVKHCFTCKAPLREGSYYSRRKVLARDANVDVTVYYCERHTRHDMRSAEAHAHRSEVKCERRGRSLSQRRRGQRRIAVQGPTRFPGSQANKLHHVRRTAARMGWRQVDGVWMAPE